MLPLDGSIEAEFSDGFILNETELNDVSPHDSKHNILRDILEKWSEPEHGRLVRFSVFWKNARYDVDWTTLPDNARPIRYKKNENSFNEEMQIDGTWVQVSEPIYKLVSIGFGYQYTDENGQNVQEVKELT